MATGRLPFTVIISLLLLLVPSVLSTTPLDIPDDEFSFHNGTIVKRCASPCGFWGQLCCQSGESCYTDANNEAQCGASGAQTTAAAAAAAGAGTGYWHTYTSTWVETGLITKTSIYSSYVGGAAATPAAASWAPAATATSAPLQCQWASGESACGNICCASGQYCMVAGQCGVSGQQSSATLSAPLRPTASTMVVKTATLQTTTTVGFMAPVPTGQSAGVTSSQMSSSGLSAGAIAGIVIGVLAAIIILILICLCVCFKSAWDALLGLFGLGKRRRTETVEYSSHHHGSRYSGAWPGDRPARIARPPPKRSSGLGGAGKAAAGLGGLAIALGIKRRHDKKRVEEKSDLSSETSYSDTYTGTSSSSSDRRTRDTRRDYTSRR